MTLTEQKFDQGMSIKEYLDQIKVNREPFAQILDAVEIPSETLVYFLGLGETLRLAVFTADWCGDALSTTPSILRLAEQADTVVVKVFNRDEELELANSFLPPDRAGTVPVFVVLDTSMREVARFIETASALVPAIDAMDDQIARESAQQSEAEARQARGGKRTAFRLARASEWGKVILDEFRRTVAEGLAMAPDERPAIGGTRWPPGA